MVVGEDLLVLVLGNAPVPRHFDEHPAVEVRVVADRAGEDRVDPDPVGGEVDRHRLRQPDDPVLGGDVGDVPVHRLDPCGRGDVDDAAVSLAADHVVRDRTADVERAVEVDRHHEPPALG